METKTIFEKVWSKTEDELDAEEKELKKREMQRAFEADYDKATNAILDCQKKKKAMEKDEFQNFCLNDYREADQDIKDCKAAREDIAAKYQEFFGVEIKR